LNEPRCVRVRLVHGSEVILLHDYYRPASFYPYTEMKNKSELN
jgi:hypothetical protein